MRLAPLLAIIAIVAACAACGNVPAERTYDILTRTFDVDRVYRSMKGPQSTDEVRLLDSEPPELLWITGYRAVMVGADGATPESPEFMCHSNLDFDVLEHADYFHWDKMTSGRLFTLSQGQLSVEFPEGYGIPILSNESLQSTNQLLNLNPDTTRRKVRHKVAQEIQRKSKNQQPHVPYRLDTHLLRIGRGKTGNHEKLSGSKFAAPY